MTDEPDATNTGPPRAGEDALAALIRAAGKRPEPRGEDLTRVFAASHAAWQSSVRGRRRRRYVGAVAAAVVVLAAVTLSLWRWSPPAPAARVTALRGSVELRASDGTWRPLPGTLGELPAGSRLRTVADGRAALVLAPGTSLRLDSATELTLASRTDLTLAAGTLYYDSGLVGAPPIEIATPLGTLHDRGTQFEVRAAAASLRIRVREGAVALQGTGSAAPIMSAAGEQVSIDARGGVERQAFATDAPEWAWATSLAGTLVVDGRTVFEVLTWVARESGKRLEFADATAELRARSVRLAGRGTELSPAEALDVVIGTAEGLAVELAPGVIIVRPR